MLSLIAILCVWVLLRTLGDAAELGGLRSLEGAGTIAWGTGIAIVVGAFASGGTQVANRSRLARTKRDAIVTAVAAFFIAKGLKLGFGAVGLLVYLPGARLLRRPHLSGADPLGGARWWWPTTRRAAS